MVRAGLANTAATVFLRNAAAERLSMFYASAAGVKPTKMSLKTVTKITKETGTNMTRAYSSTEAKK